MTIQPRLARLIKILFNSSEVVLASKPVKIAQIPKLEI